MAEEGWEVKPTWKAVLQGARPEQPQHEEGEGPETGEWRHGWQFQTSSVREHHFRARQLMPRLSRPSRALLRSCSGPGAGQWLATLPVSPQTTMTSQLLQVALRRRLRIPLGLGTRWCQGRRWSFRLDPKGDHVAACRWTGLLQRRAKPLERVWQQVLRKAGARVVPQRLMRDMDVAVRADGGRQLDVVAYGLPLYGGLPLCGDATLVSPLDAAGWPKFGSDVHDGACFAAARRRKARRYPELAAGEQGRLVVLGCDIGGRWEAEAWKLLQGLVKAKSRATPELLRRSSGFAWQRRWASMVAVAAQTALAASLAEPMALNSTFPDGGMPDLSDVLCRASAPPEHSRLAWR